MDIDEQPSLPEGEDEPVTGLETINLAYEVSAQDHGLRLDAIAATAFPTYSRSRIQQWIKGGELTLDGQQVKPKTKCAAYQRIQIQATLSPQDAWIAEPVEFPVIWEDDLMMIINKPVGLVVHPGAGNWTGTLVNGLIHYRPEQANLPRAGIVHRLDKDTSGLMVVAKTLESHTYLVDQLQQRLVKRAYEAIVYGMLKQADTISAPIGRHPTQRIKMAVIPSGKSAISHYETVRNFQHFSHVAVRLETGRTHQIRVHLTHLGYPLVGDPVYKGNRPEYRDITPEVRAQVNQFPRQALHAKTLGLTHPEHGWMDWQAELPADMLSLVELLAKDDG